MAEQRLIVPDTSHLFAPLRAGLVAVLRALEPADWDRPTVAGAWRVRDVVAHLLDAELRTIGAHRDGHMLTAGEVRSYADAMELIQRLNAEGVAFARRLSPQLLVDLLAVTGDWMSTFVTSLDPDARAVFAVAWAGESQSTNRFDTAREYTERWHHEMQIRTALGPRGNATALLSEEFAVPLIETSVRALPHAYHESAAGDGSTLVVVIDGSSWRRTYSMRREAGEWTLRVGDTPNAGARIAGDVDVWWRLLFNALKGAEATRSFVATGAPELLAPLWGTRSVMV